MAELGLAIAGLASIAEVVGTRLYNYIHIAKNADAEVLTLVEQIDSLRGTLWRIKTLVGNSSFPNDFAAPYLSPVHACVSALDKVRDKLSTFRDERGEDPLIVKRKWKWPFSRTETLDLRSKIQAYETSLGLMLTADNICTTLKILHEAQSSYQTLKDVQQYFQAASQIRLDDEKQKLLSLVSPVSPLATLKTNVKLWRSGTCLWFTEGPEFTSWLTSENSSLWIYGIPGAGKSILSAQAIQKALSLSGEDNAVAYFFCDYRNRETQMPGNILGSLVEQLARQNKRSYQQLKTFADDYSHTTNMQNWKPDCDDLFQLVIQMSENFTNVNILVDGLDECDEHVVEVTSQLSRFGEASSRIRTLLSSRQLVEIQHIVQRFQSLSIAARSTDIRLYIAHELEQRTHPSSPRPLIIDDQNICGEIMDALVSQAHGMFRWVAVQLDYFSDLPSDYAIREALVSLPPDLAQSYERLLHMINRKSAATQQLVQRTLMWLASGVLRSYRAHSMRSLQEALSITSGEHRFDPSKTPGVKQILRACGSLVRFNVDNHMLELAHFTVVEFLNAIDPERQPTLVSYKTSDHSQWKYLTLTSLTYLCYDNSWPIPPSYADYVNLVEKYPLLAPILINLPFYLNKVDTRDQEVVEILMRFFSPQHADSRLLWLYHSIYSDDIPSGRGPYGAREVLRLTPLAPICYAAMLNLPEVCRLLIAEGQSCNAASSFGSPLQLAIMKQEALKDEPFLCHRFADESYFHQILQTIQMLLSCGADVPTNQTLFGEKNMTRSVLALAAVIIPATGSLFRELAAAGAPCEPDCISVLQKLWDNGSCVDKFVHSLQYVHEEQVEPSSLTNFRSLRDQALRYRAVSRLGPHILQKAQADDSVTNKSDLVFIAAKFDQAPALNYLGDLHCVDVNMKNSLGQAALHVAAQNRSNSVIKALLDIPGTDTAIRNSSGDTALHIVVAEGTDESTIRMLLDRPEIDLNMQNNRGRSILHVAAGLPLVGTLEVLLFKDDTQGALRNNREQQAESAVSCSVTRSANRSTLPRIRRQGFDIEARDNDGMTALHIACHGGNLYSATLLVELGASIEARNHRAMTPLHVACDCGHQGIVALLLGLGASIEARMSQGMAALHLASQKGEQVLIELLIEHGAHIEAHDDRDMTPLHFAAQRGDSQIAEFLIKHGADIEAHNDRHMTPLHLACSNGRSKTVALLVHHGANIAIQRKQGWAAVHYAVWQDRLNVLKYFQSRKSGWDKPITFWIGDSIVKDASLCHLASAFGPRCLSYLLKFPDLYKVTDMAGDWSHLRCAVMAGAKEAVSILLQHGARALTRANGSTELFDAVRFGKLGISHILVEHGFDGNVRNHSNISPRLLAKKAGYMELLRAMEHTSRTTFETSSHDYQPQVGGSQTLEDLRIREKRKNARVIANAIEIGDQSVVDLVCLQETPVLSPCQICGQCDLFIHALTYDEHVAFRLLERGYKPTGLQAPSHQGYARTALHICAEKGYLRLLNAILDSEPALLFLETEVHPIYLAILHKQNECLKAMLDRGQVCWDLTYTMRDKDRHNVLPGLRTVVNIPGLDSQRTYNKFRLLESSDLSMITLRPNDVNLHDEFKEYIDMADLRFYAVLLPLHCAALVRNKTAVQHLLEAGSHKDCLSAGVIDSAFCIAIWMKDFEVAEILLSVGSSPYRYNFAGRSPVNVLASRSPGLFLKYHKSLKQDIHPDSLGEAPIEWILRNVEHDTLPAFLNLVGREHQLHGRPRPHLSLLQTTFMTSNPIMETYLLNAGIDLGRWDKDCGGALNGYWYNCHISVLKRLMKRIGHEKSKRLLNRKPAFVSTPLYQAALMGQQDIPKLFLKYGADVNIIGGLLGTPLMAAAGYGRLCIVKDFVNAGAELSCFSTDENRVRSAVDLAKHFPEIQRWLLVERYTEQKRITWKEALA